MRVRLLIVAVVALLGLLALPALAQKGRWGSSEDATVRAMIEMERMWATSNCAPQPKLKEVIADEFQGTAPGGSRYGKADAVSTDMDALDRECRLGDVKVQFFGDSVAVAYGDESSLRRDKSGTESRRCLTWTDTWLKRDGRWQIVAAQDTVVACK